MSLLSELIAQLTALIEQNRESDGALLSARDHVEGALGQVRAATVDSSSPISRLREIKVVRDGKVTQFYPWDSEAAQHGD